MSAAVSAGDLALAMSRANNSARLAGADMNNFIGYVTTVADVSQKSAESVGESFKTIFSRFGNVKAGKYVASVDDQNSDDYSEDSFESLNDIETVLTRVGIKVRENANTWRDIDDILADIGDKWSSWDTTTQNAVATVVAGTRQRENVITLFENWSDVTKYAQIAEDAYGTATEKMKAYSDSVEASQKRITNAVEKFALDLNLSGALKKVYSLVADITEGLEGFLVVLTLVKSSDILTMLGNGLTKLSTKFMSMGLQTQTPQGFTAGWTTAGKHRDSELINAYKTVEFQQYTEKLNAAASETDGLTQVMIQRINTETNLLNANKQNIVKTTMQNALTGTLSETYYNELDADATLTMKKIVLAAIHDNIIDASEEDLNTLTQENLTGKELVAQQKLLAEKTNALAQEMNTRGAGDALRVFYGTPSRNYNDPTVRAETLQRAKEARLSAGLGMAGMIGGGWVGNTIGSAITDNSTIQMGMSMGSGMLFNRAFSNAPDTIKDVKALYNLDVATKSLKKARAAWDAIEVTDRNFQQVSRDLNNAETNFASASTAAAGISKGATALSVGLFGVTAAMTAVSVAMALYNNAIKKNQEAFEKASSQYSSAKSGLSTADKYDELVKGVDKFGNNLTLSDDEYSQFLEYSNELAEIFPSLIVNIDDAGNKFIGMGSSVGSVSSKIEDLVDEYQKLTDAQMFKGMDGFFGIGDTSVYGQNYKTLIESLETYALVKNNSLAELESFKNLSDFARNNNETYQLYKNAGYSNEEAAEKTQADLQAKYDEASKTYQAERKAINNSMLSENKAYLRNEQEFANMMENMTDEESTLLTEALSNITISGAENAKTYLQKVKNTATAFKSALEQIGDEKYTVNNKAVLYTDIAIDDASAYSSLSEMEQYRAGLLNKLLGDGKWMEDENGNITAEAITVMQGYGFEFVDNGNGSIDVNDFADKNNPVNQLREILTGSYTGDLSWDLSDFSYAQVDNLIEAANSGYLTNNTSYETMHNLANAGNTTVSDYKQAYAKLALFQQRVGDESSPNGMKSRLNSFFGDVANREEEDMGEEELKAKIAETFSDLDTTTKDGIYEIAKDIKKGAESWGDELGEAMSNLKLSEFDQYINAVKMQVKDAFGDLDTSEGVDGLIDTYGEMKDAVDAMVSSYDKLKACRDEQNSQGHISLQTALDLVATNAEYAQAIDWTTDKITLKGDAEKIVMQIQTQAAIASVEAAMQEAEQTRESVRQKLNAISSETQMTQALSTASQANVEQAQTMDLVAQATHKATLERLAYNAALEGDEAAANQYKTQAQSIEIKANVSTEGITQVTEDEYLSAQEIQELAKQYGFIQNSNGEWIAEELEDSESQWATEQKSRQTFIDMLKEYDGTDYSNEYFKSQIKSAESGSTELDRLKAIVSAINKEFAQMQSYLNGDKGDISANYYNEMATALQNELKEVNRLMGTTTKYSKEYYEYLQQSRELQVQINNLNDEQVQDQIDILEAASVTNSQLTAQYRQLVTTSDTYLEYVQNLKKLGEAFVKVFEKSYNAIERSIKLLQDSKPEEWANSWNSNYTKVTETALSKIDEYYSNLEEYYRQEISATEAILNDAEIVGTLTDEQIDDLVDKINTAKKAILEAQIAAKEDKKEYQESVYSALTNEIERYKDQLETQKTLIEEVYDKEIDKLNDKNEAIERTNKLIQLQQDLLNAQEEKQRVYRSGKLMPVSNYIG